MSLLCSSRGEVDALVQAGGHYDNDEAEVERFRGAAAGERRGAPWAGQAPGSFQSSQAQTARPMTSSRSRPVSHGSSSVNIVTH